MIDPVANNDLQYAYATPPSESERAALIGRLEALIGCEQYAGLPTFQPGTALLQSPDDECLAAVLRALLYLIKNSAPSAQG